MCNCSSSPQSTAPQLTRAPPQISALRTTWPSPNSSPRCTRSPLTSSPPPLQACSCKSSAAPTALLTLCYPPPETSSPTNTPAGTPLPAVTPPSRSLSKCLSSFPSSSSSLSLSISCKNWPCSKPTPRCTCPRYLRF